MHVGAVAMIDALGFKGIYRRHKPQAVIERMRAIRREVEDYPNGAVVPSIIRIVNVSDMIVIGLYDVEGDSSLTIASVAFLVLKLLRFAANGEPALAYRGCIAYGEFEMDDNVLLGPAIRRSRWKCGAGRGIGRVVHAFRCSWTTQSCRRALVFSR